MIPVGNRRVVYVGPFSFPNGGAAARRILGNAKSLQAAGFLVSIACGQMPGDGGDSFRHAGIEVVSLGERTSEHLPRQLKHLAYLRMGGRTIDWLDSLAERPYAIVLYSGYSPYLLRLTPWARRNHVRLIFDAVEWYDPDSFLHRFSLYQLNIEFAMRQLLPKVPNIIAISSYLRDYYANRGCRCVLVPPTLNVLNTPFKNVGRSAESPLRLVYAGSPGKKDLLGNILEAVFSLHERGFDVCLSVAGIPAAHATKYRSVRNRSAAEVAACIDFLGVLSHSASIELVSSADFSLLLRHDARYARAGFPTKFVESMSVGTPVICNITSDLDRYLHEGVTGFISEGPCAEDLERAILRALCLSSNEHVEMRSRCRALAIQSFDFRVFSALLSDFFNSARV